MKEKTVREYVDLGCGFPVILKGAKFIHVQGDWALKINYNQYELLVIKHVASLNGRLSGDHVHFIRLYFDMTLKQFAEIFGVSHVSVIKWEKKRNKPTEMAWGIEKDIRMFIQATLSKKPSELYKLYVKLKPEKSKVAEKITLNARKLAA